MAKSFEAKQWCGDKPLLFDADSLKHMRDGWTEDDIQKFRLV
jgi:hypothetical protein